MSKPLSIAQQLIGLGLVIYGVIDFQNNLGPVFWGLLLLVIGGVGVRKRFKEREITNAPDVYPVAKNL